MIPSSILLKVFKATNFFDFCMRGTTNGIAQNKDNSTVLTDSDNLLKHDLDQNEDQVFCLINGITFRRRLGSASTFSLQGFFFIFVPHLLTLDTNFTVINSIYCSHTVYILFIY